MSSLRTLISRTRRRLLLVQAARLFPFTLSFAASASLLILLASRLWGFPASPFLLAVPFACALFLSIAILLIRLPRAFDLARLLDERLALRDRLSTALTLDSDTSLTGNIFSDVVRLDAHRVSAAPHDLRRAFPIRWPRSAVLLPLLLLAFMAADRYVPQLHLGDRFFPDHTAQRAAASEAISSTADELRDLLTPPADPIPTSPDAPAPSSASPVDQRTRSTLETLDRIASQLNPDSPASAPDSALTQAAEELDSLADTLDQDAAARERAAHQTAEQLSSLAPPAPADPAAARAPSDSFRQALEQLDDFTQALSRSDFDKAEQALRDAASSFDRLSPDERKALADRLLDLSSQLHQARAEQSEQAQQAAEEISRQSPTQPSPTSPPPAQPLPDIEELTRSFEDQGLPAPDARELAEQLKAHEQQQQAHEQSARDLEQLARDLNELAREMDPSQSTPPAESQPQSDSATRPDSSSQPPSSSPPDTSSPSQSESSPSSESQSQPESNPDSDAPNQSNSQTDPQTDPAQPPADTSQPTRDPGQQDQPPQGQQQPQQQDQPQQEGASPDPSSTPDPSSQPQPVPSPTDPSQNPNSPAVDRITRTLRNLSEAPSQAQRQREISQTAREEAQRLLDQLSPEDRQQLERWARDNPDSLPQGPSQPSPSSTGDSNSSQPGSQPGSSTPSSSPPPVSGYERIENLDASRPDATPADDQVLAEWFRDPQASDRAADSSPLAQSADRLRSASQALERAADDQSIPARYRDLIRRWAQRIPQSPDSPPAPPPAQPPRN